MGCSYSEEPVRLDGYAVSEECVKSDFYSSIDSMGPRAPIFSC